MPPAVYIVVAVLGAVATGYALKEFVYDPHIAPVIHEWRERRRARRASRPRMHTPVPATQEYGSPHHTPTRGPSPIELDTVVASEVDEWRTSTNMRRRQNNVFDDRVPSEVDYPLLSPTTPTAAGSPPIIRSLRNETAPIRPSQSLSPPTALPIPNLASFATDVDYTASSIEVTPLVQTAVLQSNLTSPGLTATSPFSDVFELAQSRISEPEMVRAGSGSDDDVFSVPSSVSSITATDDEDDNDSFGSGGSWHDIRNEVNRP